MKICLYGISTIALGKHNLRDSRLDQAHQLVEAKKKTYAQIDLADDSSLADADAIIVSTELRADLILKDLEFVETASAEIPPTRSAPPSPASTTPSKRDHRSRCAPHG
jgi:hypothetical protein